MFSSGSQIARYVVAALGGRNAPRLAIGFISGFPLKMVVDGVHSTYPSILFLAAVNKYEVVYFSFFATALIFSPFLVGRPFVADRSLGDVRTIDHLIEKAQLSETQKKEVWLKFLDKTVRTLDPRLDEDTKNFFEALGKEGPK